MLKKSLSFLALVMGLLGAAQATMLVDQTQAHEYTRAVLQRGDGNVVEQKATYWTGMRVYAAPDGGCTRDVQSDEALKRVVAAGGGAPVDVPSLGLASSSVDCKFYTESVDVKVLFSNGTTTGYVLDMTRTSEGKLALDMTNFWTGMRLVNVGKECFFQSQKLVGWRSYMTAEGELKQPVLDSAST